MKRIIALFFVACMLVGMLVGCGPKEGTPGKTDAGGATAATGGGTDSGGDAAPSTEQELIDQLISECKDLSGLDAYNFFNTLADRGLSQSGIIDFFIQLPISQANEGVYKVFKEDALDVYIEASPVGELYGDYAFKTGMGTEFVGPFSGNTNIKLPYTDYIPVNEGPIGNPNEKYTIGFVCISGIDSWMANLYDAAMWEVARHDNLEIVVQDYGLDGDGLQEAMEVLIAKDVDGIVLWPRVEATSANPSQTVIDAGIPLVTVDRFTGATDASSVAGNFPANGAQLGMYLVWKLYQESNGTEIKGNLITLSKIAGGTADTLRRGHFLKVISYFPDINYLQNYWDNDNVEECLKNVQSAMQQYDEIDAIFLEALTEAPPTYEAITAADRWNSRADGKKIIILSIDDTKELFHWVSTGAFDVNTPYTPFVSDVAVRYLIKKIEGEDMPQHIAIPNIPMVTLKGDVIFGLQTQTCEQWQEYASGPPYAAEGK